MDDVVVVGGGIVGLSVAAELAARGRRVTVLERSLGLAAAGSSKGSARFRQAANLPDDGWLDLGIRARERWVDVEPLATGPIFHPTGNLSIGTEDDLAELARGLRSRSLPVEEVEGVDLPRRWPHLRPQHFPVLFQPDGEVIAADVAYAATVALAGARGVSIVRDSPVQAVEVRADRVAMTTPRRTVDAARVVLAAGPWIAPLAQMGGLSLDVRVSCQTVAWFELPDIPVTTPTVTDLTGAEPYLLPDPGHGVKAAEHARGPEIDPDDPGTTDLESVERLRTFLAALFVVPIAAPATTDTCLYTNAPGDRIALAHRGPVVAVSACSGQGFQYAPAVAELVADAVDAT